MPPRPRGAQCGCSPCGVLVLAVYIGFTDVLSLFWLFKGNYEIGEIGEIGECLNNEMSGFLSNVKNDCYENNGY